MTIDEAAHELFFPLLVKFCAIMSAHDSGDYGRLSVAVSNALPLYRRIEQTQIGTGDNSNGAGWKLDVCS